MKPTSSSIYRRLEQLTDWIIPVVDRMPKSLSSQVVGERLLNALLNAQEYVAIALRTRNVSERIEAIQLSILHIDAVRSSMRAIYERSRNSASRVLSTEQYGYFVSQMEVITDETSKWLSAAERTFMQTNPVTK